MYRGDIGNARGDTEDVWGNKKNTVIYGVLLGTYEVVLGTYFSRENERLQIFGSVLPFV